MCICYLIYIYVDMWQNIWQEHPCRHSSQWRRNGRRCSTHCGWFPLELMVQTMVKKLCLCSPCRTIGMQRSTYSPWSCRCSPWSPPHSKACGYLRGDCDLVGAPCCTRVLEGSCRPVKRNPCWRNFLIGPVTMWGPHSGTVCPWRTAPYGRVTHDSSWRTISHGRDPTLEEGRTPLPEQ